MGKESWFYGMPNRFKRNIIFAWGCIKNRFDGWYIFYLNTMPTPDQTGNDLDPSKLTIEEYPCGVGTVETLTPGTVFENQRIVKHVHEHHRKRDVFIQDPSLIEIVRLADKFDLSDVRYLEKEPGSRLDDLRVAVIPNYEGYDAIVIPCGVIADYYFFGFPRLTHYVLERNVDRYDRHRNKVYDPEESQYEVLSDGRVLAYVRLEREMFSRDQVTIARLAHDLYFWDCAMEMSSKLVMNNPAYLETKFPIKQPTTISFYGMDLTLGNKRVLWGLSIAFCTAKLPFDGLVVSRDNPGGRTGVGEVDIKALLKEVKDEKDLKPKVVEKSVYVGTSKEQKIGSQNARFNSVDSELQFPKDKKFNFPEDLIVSEEDFDVGVRTENLTKFLLEFGPLLEFTTSLKRSGSKNVRRMVFRHKGPIEDPDVEPVTCFSLIEKALNDFPVEFEVKVICPFPFGRDKYSILPAQNYRTRHSKRDLNFCYLNVRKNKRTIFKRLLFVEIEANGSFFYVLDLQPNETEKKDTSEIKWSSRRRAVVFCSKKRSQITDFKKLFAAVVESRGKWDQMMSDFKYKSTKIKHTTSNGMRDRILMFIKKQLVN